jgi:hypothetical protein
MKKLGLLALALTIGLSMLSAPTLASYNAAVYQPPLEPQEAADLYSKYYNEKDQAKRYELAKEFLEKYPKVDEYWKKGPKNFVQTYELKQVYDKCAQADKVYFAIGGQNEANLNNLMTTCDAYLAKDPNPNIAVTNRLALATGFGVLAGFYKDTARSNTYAEKSLKLLEPTAPPSKEWDPATWAKFRNENIARLTQYQGLYKLRQTPPDHEGAVEFLSKAATLKEGPAAKDPNTYLLRAEATTAIYTKLNNEYNALSDEGKVGEPGKALLSKIYPVVAKMANDYARVVALTEGKKEYEAVYNDAKAQTKAFVEFLNKTMNPDDLYKTFKADVNAPDVEIKMEESNSAAAPPVAPPTGKGAKAVATTAGDAATEANGNGTKAGAKTTTKKPAPKKRKR